MNEHKQEIGEIKISPQQLVELFTLIEKQTISNNTGKQVLVEMFTSGQSATAIVDAKGLGQISDEGALAETIAQIIAENEAHVASYRAGKTKIKGWFVGQVMKASKGQASPEIVNKLIKQELEK